MIARQPQQSLPKQARGDWADLKGAYRLLNNPRVEPCRVGRTHRVLTREACAAHPVVLCVQDDSDLSSVKVEAERHLMHHTLAVLPGGRLLGVLQQRFVERVARPRDETRKQRASRWRESDLWQDAVVEVGPPPAGGCRFVHVADRGADNLRFMHACVKVGVGFVVRAAQDRRVDDATDKLWSHLSAQRVPGHTAATIGKQRDARGRVTRKGREAKLAVRCASRVQLERPWNHPAGPGDAADGPLRVNVVYLSEVDPPPGVEPVDWMLLTSEPVASFEQALQVVESYRCRWVIEEWHRALKEGCRLERSQLQDAAALKRLTAVLSVVAVRLVQLRDLADDATRRDRPAALRRLVPPAWITLVSALTGVKPRTLTPQQFWHTLARRGGWLARKGDPRPGWKAIWAGWNELEQMVQGIELLQSTNKLTLTGCG